MNNRVRSKRRLLLLLLMIIVVLCGHSAIQTRWSLAQTKSKPPIQYVPAAEAQKRIKTHINYIQAQYDVMEKLHGWNEARGMLLDALKSQGFNEWASSPVGDGHWLHYKWALTSCGFYGTHTNELGKLLWDAQNATVKASDMARFDAGMERWKVKEKQLQQEYLNFLKHWAQKYDFDRRHYEQEEKVRAELKPNSGAFELVERVKQAMAPMNREGEKIQQQIDESWKRIADLSALKVFSYDMSQEYGH